MLSADEADLGEICLRIVQESYSVLALDSGDIFDWYRLTPVFSAGYSGAIRRYFTAARTLEWRSLKTSQKGLSSPSDTPLPELVLHSVVDRRKGSPANTRRTLCATPGAAEGPALPPSANRRSPRA